MSEDLRGPNVLNFNKVSMTQVNQMGDLKTSNLWWSNNFSFILLFKGEGFYYFMYGFFRHLDAV